MIFHYCTEGDSVLSIAREYGVSPVRLIEENGLADPDRLAVGQCLAIYRSSRAYTVRGGDTFDGIVRRFAMNARDLLKFNPGIGDKRLLYPGQSLALGRVETSYGPLTVNGCISKHISLSKLRCFSSALTYLTITDSDLIDRSGFGSQKERELIDFSAQNGILPLVLVHPFGDPETLATMIARSGYRGAQLHEAGDREVGELYARALKKAGLIALVPYSNERTDDACDWLTVPFGDHRVSTVERFHALPLDSEQAYRIMAELPYCGVEISSSDGRCIKTLPLADCTHLAYRRNSPIKKRDDGKVGFSFTATVFGSHEHREVIFDDLATLKNGLAVLGESGICGMTIYPEWCPRGLPTLLHRTFDVIKTGDERSDGHFYR